MIQDGNLYLHAGTIYISIIPVVISFVLYAVFKEPWRLYLGLFFSAGIVLLLLDTAGILYSHLHPSIPVILFAAFCAAASCVFLIILKLYRFGIRFVLQRWETKHLFLFLLPGSFFAAAVFMYFSLKILTLNLIVLVYSVSTGLIVFFLSLTRSRKKATGRFLPPSERELVFLLLTTITVMPLELFEYVWKLVLMRGPLFPIRLIVTPVFFITISIFFTVTGVRAIRQISTSGINRDLPQTLTVREREVSALLLEGLTHREISAKLFISHRTVDRHVENIYKKCSVNSKADFFRSVIIPR